MKYNTYAQNIAIWHKQFGKPLSAYAAFYGPCARCGKKSHHRHHKAHDYIFACVLPKRFAQRYIQFHPDDIDFLCKKCHVNAHRIYHELIEAFNEALKMLRCRYISEEMEYKLCIKYKKMFTRRYLKWRNWGKKK